MVKNNTFGRRIRFLVIEAFKNGKTTQKISENVEKTVSKSTVNRWNLADIRFQ
jgi:hypothetical protein